MNAYTRSQIPTRLPFHPMTPASEILDPSEYTAFRVHDRPRLFINHIYQYTDVELADLVQVADRRYTSPSKRDTYYAIVNGVAAERRLRAFDTPLHRQLRFMLACRNAEQNMFIAAKTHLYGDRHAPETVTFAQYVAHLPDYGLKLSDFFKSKREFHRLGLYRRDRGYYLESASDNELKDLESQLEQWLQGKGTPSRRTYRENVLVDIRQEMQNRAAGEDPEMRFVRLIHRASRNLYTIERMGWKIREIFEHRALNLP